MAWAWNTGTARERANIIRSHAKDPTLSDAALMQVFQLSQSGLSQILRGADWNPSMVPNDH